MSRAVRRQQQRAPQKQDAAKRSNIARGLRQPRQTRGARPTAPKRGLRPRVPGWLEEIISELRKVTWPTREDTVYLAWVVIVVAVFVGILLGAIDIFFNQLVDRLLLR
jgi:preprotein translocase subunit SecE